MFRMAEVNCEHCMEYLILWHGKKTDYENAARKIRKLKKLIREQKEQIQQIQRMSRKQRKQLNKLNELLEMQDTLLHFMCHN